MLPCSPLSDRPLLELPPPDSQCCRRSTAAAAGAGGDMPAAEEVCEAGRQWIGTQPVTTSGPAGFQRRRSLRCRDRREVLQGHAIQARDWNVPFQRPFLSHSPGHFTCFPLYGTKTRARRCESLPVWYTLWEGRSSAPAAAIAAACLLPATFPSYRHPATAPQTRQGDNLRSSHVLP
jgi:hypothetical protein